MNQLCRAVVVCLLYWIALGDNANAHFAVDVHLDNFYVISQPSYCWDRRRGVFGLKFQKSASCSADTCGERMRRSKAAHLMVIQKQAQGEEHQKSSGQDHLLHRVCPLDPVTFQKLIFEHMKL